MLPEDVRKRIVPVGGDMRSFRLNQKFGLVIAPFSAFLHNRVSSVKRRNLEFRIPSGNRFDLEYFSSQANLKKGHEEIEPHSIMVMNGPVSYPSDHDLLTRFCDIESFGSALNPNSA